MQDLLEAARAAYANAHAPYSRFRVGAAVRGASGRVFAGANVENASYPEGNCAEASALAALVAAGERRITEALVLAAGERLCSPCGGCRQRLAEFAGPDVPIHLCGPEGLRRTVTMGELLPLAFELRQSGSGAAEPRRQGDTALRGPAPAGGSAVDVIRARAPDFAPRVGLILGSGLSAIADAIEGATALDYVDLPGFPRPSIEGHAGRLVLGRLDGVPVACRAGCTSTRACRRPRSTFCRAPLRRSAARS
jgi:cytidine deaminase